MTFITLNVYTGDGQRFKEEITVKNDGYIDKAECLRRGYVRKSCGIYKMSLLEKYAARGWLELGDPKYSREDRLRAAKRLQKDCEMSHFMSVGVSGTREKVDGKGKNADDVEAICKARERYFAASGESGSRSDGEGGRTAETGDELCGKTRFVPRS